MDVRKWADRVFALGSAVVTRPLEGRAERSSGPPRLPAGSTKEPRTGLPGGPSLAGGGGGGEKGGACEIQRVGVWAELVANWWKTGGRSTAGPEGLGGAPGGLGEVWVGRQRSGAGARLTARALGGLCGARGGPWVDWAVGV